MISELKDPIYRKAASVTIRRLSKMTPQGRKDIADWLRRTAQKVQKNPEEFTSTFRAHYWYRASQCSKGERK